MTTGLGDNVKDVEVERPPPFRVKLAVVATMFPEEQEPGLPVLQTNTVHVPAGVLVLVRKLSVTVAGEFAWDGKLVSLVGGVDPTTNPGGYHCTRKGELPLKVTVTLAHTLSP